MNEEHPAIELFKCIIIILSFIAIIGLSGLLLFTIITNPKTHSAASKVCSPYQVETYNDNIVVCKGSNGYEVKDWPVERNKK